MNTDTELARILVIDDNTAIHNDFRKVFDSTSIGEQDELDALFFEDDISPKDATPAVKYEQVDAFQGKEGHELMQKSIHEERPFDMAFVDMRMPPGWDGLETIKNLWKEDPDLQVVVCTAFSDYSWSEFFSKLGAQDGLLILKKPFDHAEVLQLAFALTQKRKLIRLANAKMETMEKLVQERTAKLEQAHQESERMLSAIASLLIGIDAEGLIYRWNGEAENMFGLTAAETFGKPFVDLPIKWEDPAAFINLFDRQEQKGLELVFENAEGQARTIGSSIYPIFDQEKFAGNLMLGSDITEKRNLENQLYQSQKMESVGQLAAGVAHEINTPMQYIGDNVRYVSKSLKKLDPLLEYLHLLADPEVSDEQFSEIRKTIPETIKPSKIKSSLKQIPDALNDSIEGVVSVSKIVAAMKEFSHPGSDQKSLACVNHILESTITVAKNEWKYVADMETDFDEELIKIDALPGELNQAFLNIIVNAAHAIGDRVTAKELTKGLIRIGTKSAGDRVLVTIQDNGGGIPVHAREKVFDPFFTTKDVGKGTGQGLAIAFTVITQKHDGKIAFTVEEGVGTTFNIELPRDAIATSDEPDNEPVERLASVTK